MLWHLWNYLFNSIGLLYTWNRLHMQKPKNAPMNMFLLGCVNNINAALNMTVAVPFLLINAKYHLEHTHSPTPSLIPPPPPPPPPLFSSIWLQHCRALRWNVCAICYTSRRRIHSILISIPMILSCLHKPCKRCGAEVVEILLGFSKSQLLHTSFFHPRALWMFNVLISNA